MTPDNEKETDKDYRTRLLNAMQRWGALGTAIMEASGDDLDHIGTILKTPRLSVVLSFAARPVTTDGIPNGFNKGIG